MIRRMILLMVAAGFTLSIGWSLPVQARVLLSEEYGKAEPTRVGKIAGAKTAHGDGWRPARGGNNLKAEEIDLVRLPVAGLIDGSRGTVELDLVRGKNDPSSVSDGLFALVNADGDSVFAVRIDWTGDPLHMGKPVVAAESLWYTETRNPKNLIPGKYVGSVPLNKKIGVGKAFNLTFTWGPSPADCSIYLDGRKLQAIVAKPFRMKEFVDSAVEIAIGGQPTKSSARVYDQATSLFKGVYIYGEPLDGTDLYANPAKYRSSAATPAIASVEHDAAIVAGFSGKLVAGNTMTVTVEGIPGTAGSFDVVHFPDLDRKIALDWRGWGVYLEEKIFYEPGEVNLRDVEGYRVYAAKAPFDLAALSAEPVEGASPPLAPVKRLDFKEQAYTLELLEIDTPYYVAVVAEMRDGTLRPVISPIANRPMTENAPGVYTGSHQVGYQDRYPRAVVVGRLVKGDATTILAGNAKSVFAIDPALTIAVATAPNELKADEKSASKVTVTVTDANGNPVSGHKLKFVLATTSQYTGVVGGGAFADQVGGSMTESAFGETDLFGRLTATYVAGFAAKTAVIVARDMASGDTGAGWVKTYITATAQLELEPVQQLSRMMDAGFVITVSSSDEWLTADGKSQARITARVTLGGNPVEGHQVSFEASPGAGAIRVVQGKTDRGGEARAVFTAGRKIGIALITATDTTVGISGSVAIELRSDAPAKIAIKIKPEKLPADGRSRADLLVQVTDINDNPNDNVEVEYDLISGGGRIRDARGVTDRKGESASEYTAGRSPGMVTFEITVRSVVPTDEELAKARAFALAVTDHKFF